MAYPEQDIKIIIQSFEDYAMGDIKHNKPKPIAAFILSICFIDQMAVFRYHRTVLKRTRPDTFINKYMPAYGGLQLYEKVRNFLVHAYSSNKIIDIDKVGYENVAYEIKNGVIHINTNVFISHLEKAFLDFKNDLLTLPDAAENARKQSTITPVLVHTAR